MADRLVLLTRPLEQSREVARELKSDGIGSLIWPLTRVVQADAPPTLPEGVQALLFTSANGVRAFAELDRTRRLPAFCVGVVTAAAARSQGFEEVRVADGDSAALADMARRSGFRRFVHLRGVDVAGDLRGDLAEHGICVEEKVVYRAEETGPPPPEVAQALARGQVAAVTVWSPRGASILARHLAGIDRRAMTLIAISAAAAAPLAGVGFGQCRIAESPSREGVLAEIRALFQGKAA